MMIKNSKQKFPQNFKKLDIIWTKNIVIKRHKTISQPLERKHKHLKANTQDASMSIRLLENLEKSSNTPQVHSWWQNFC